MANSTEDGVQPVENKCDEVEEPSSPTEKGEQSSGKITLIFHAVGNAPILKKRKFIVESTRTVAAVSLFLRRFMKLTDADSLVCKSIVTCYSSGPLSIRITHLNSEFLYVNQAFSPGLDQTIGNLFECFGAEGMLGFHYCTSPAWG